MSPNSSPMDAIHHLQQLHNSGKVEVFTLPSHPSNSEKVCFIAQVSGLVDIAHLDILINGTRVVSSSDIEARLYGGPFAGTITYQAIAYDKAGHSIPSDQRSFTTTGNADTQPPAVHMVASPPQARAGEQVVFTADAQDAGGLARLELWVSGDLVQTSTGGHCSYTGESFPPGSVAYWAIAYDQAGNRTIAGPYHLEVSNPPPAGVTTISGQLAGQRQFAFGVKAHNVDQPDQTFSTPLDADGRYVLAGLPDGDYQVAPVPRGKLELSAEPPFREVSCHGQQLYGIDFVIKVIGED